MIVTDKLKRVYFTNVSTNVIVNKGHINHVLSTYRHRKFYVENRNLNRFDNITHSNTIVS